MLIAPGGGFAIVASAQDLQTVNLVALANGVANPASADFALVADDRPVRHDRVRACGSTSPIPASPVRRRPARSR